MIDKKNKLLLKVDTGILKPARALSQSKVHHNLSIDVADVLAKS